MLTYGIPPEFRGGVHYVEALSLQPMKQYIITTMLDVQYNGGLLPDIILLTQCYYHRGTCLNGMKRFCICSL